MPLLDVTEVLGCDLFYDTFEVIINAGDVTEQGLLDELPAGSTTVAGVVTPSSHNTLQRLADAANMSGSIEIYTMYRLTTGRGPAEAHEIYYRGATYTVIEVRDFTAFGPGFVNAVCALKDLNPDMAPE